MLQLHLQNYHRLPTIINPTKRFKIHCDYCQQSCNLNQEKKEHEAREHEFDKCNNVFQNCIQVRAHKERHLKKKAVKPLELESEDDGEGETKAVI